MTQPPIALFPHTRIDSRVLEGLIETFGSLTLCQPWFTEPTVLSDASEKGVLKVCFPPEALKPKEDFKRLLSEYQEWMMDHQGKNRPTAFSTGETGDETWAIRKTIRDAGKDADDPALRNTLKWHLVLHLAQNLEENRDTAQSLLQRAAKNKSPLAEAMERDEQVHDMFENLPLSAPYPYVTDRHLNLIFEAWFGLFDPIINSGIGSEAELMTLDRQVMAYALSLFDGRNVLPDEDAGSAPKQEVNAKGLKINRETLPRFSNPSAPTDPVLKTLSGRTLIMVEAI